MNVLKWFVLIETLWNVKKDLAEMISPSGSSINRNIVECKVSRACACDIFHLVLIEPLWNVKSGLL